MSAENDQQSTNAKNENDDLSDLLDSALEDFGKTKTPANESEPSDDGLISGHPDNFDSNMGFVDQATAQKATEDFRNMLLQLAQVQQVVVGQLNTDGNSSNFEDMPEQANILLQSINSLADRASKVVQAPNEADFLRELGDLQQGEEGNEFLTGLMTSFLSKDMMYPPIKEMVEKYPNYMAENKEKLDETKLNRYTKQFDIMQQLCSIYEKEEESEEAKRKQFESITILMQQMQSCGYPPEELVGSLPQGWSFDANTGMPSISDLQQASDSCCLM